MKSTIRSGVVACCGVLSVIGLTLHSGCSQSRSDGISSYKPLYTQEPKIDTRRVVLDGRLDEWGTTASAVADRDYLYARVSLGDEEVNLQSAPYTLSFVLDVDNNRSTGYRADSPRAASDLGVDLEVQFSPMNRTEGRPDSGVSVYAIGADGESSRLTHADLDVSFMPTHASEWYEVRMARNVPVRKFPSKGLQRTGTMAGLFVLWDGAGNPIGWSDPFTVDLPPARGHVRLADAVPNPSGDGTVRVVSYNTLHGSAAIYPDPFSRVMQALDPDIVLVQEWDGAAPAELEGWFSALVSADETWQAVSSPDHGVAIISRHPIVPTGSDTVEADGSPVRFVSGIVQTPIGDVAVGNMHLKCCGSIGSPEDARRMREVAAVNRTMGSALRSTSADMVIMGGDLNLVGSREPLDVLRADLDQGNDLMVVEPFVLGDTSQYTWFDEDSRFSSSRLDYLVVGESGAEIVRTFVLDTSRLSDAALARIGLDRTDTSHSDHLPVVVDLRAR